MTSPATAITTTPLIGIFPQAGRGGRGYYHNGQGGQNRQDDNDNPQNVNEIETGDRTETPAQRGNENFPSSVSTVSHTQASTVGNSRGGQNGNQFGSNHP